MKDDIGKIQDTENFCESGQLKLKCNHKTTGSLDQEPTQTALQVLKELQGHLNFLLIIVTNGFIQI